MTYLGSQYQLVTVSTTWAAALTACQALGATWSLASFHSEAEWQVRAEGWVSYTRLRPVPLRGDTQ